MRTRAPLILLLSGPLLLAGLFLLGRSADPILRLAWAAFGWLMLPMSLLAATLHASGAKKGVLVAGTAALFLMLPCAAYALGALAGR